MSHDGRLRVGHTAGAALTESFLYYLSMLRFPEVQSEYGRAAGYDRARGEDITGLPMVQGGAGGGAEEVFTSEHWLVRVYRVSL